MEYGGEGVHCTPNVRVVGNGSSHTLSLCLSVWRVVTQSLPRELRDPFGEGKGKGTVEGNWGRHGLGKGQRRSLRFNVGQGGRSTPDTLVSGMGVNRSRRSRRLPLEE